MITISKFERRNLAKFVNNGLREVHQEKIKANPKEHLALSKKDRKFKNLTVDDIGPSDKDRYRV